jgi:hypothetical protein
VETNFLDLDARYGIDRTLSHGSCLASVALALGFEKCYIPSSYTYRELHPWGSHPLVDAHWSTEGTAVVHDCASVGRAEKTAVVAQSQVALDNLVVCWNLPDRNCGRCNKCLRTRVALRLLGVKSAAFPDTISVRDVAFTSTDRKFLLDNLQLAIRRNDTDMARGLRIAIARSTGRSFLKGVDKYLFNGALMRRYQTWHRGRSGARLRLGPTGWW